MKYRQLTKEQFETLHNEFARFLASQSIDVNEWNQIKKEKPDVAEEEMNVFSDVVWDDVLTKTAYLEHFSPRFLNLFKCDKDNIHRIVIQITNEEVNLLEQEGYEWLLKNTHSEEVEILEGSKAYNEERNSELFDLIQKGSSISKGELFEYFKKLITAKK
ncbi:DUF6495 family protein [Tenacibaculum sp. nBUS_03]|uniref:DUF6495 family protein n=1 Tax=Tenacibaculum sp. nBUS_03 TaxID=3395320 RepID=UPI003EB89934